MPKEVKVPPSEADALALAEALEGMAVNIQKISNAFATIEKSRVNRSLLRLMIKDVTGVSYIEIEKVLDALPALADKYLRKK